MQLFLWILSVVGEAIVTYLVDKAIPFMMATLLGFGVFSDVNQNTPVVATIEPSHSGQACHPDPKTGIFYINLGIEPVLRDCNIKIDGRSWFDSQRNNGNYTGPYDDRSRVRLPNPQADGRDHATLVLHDINSQIHYTLALAVLSGTDDDSFQVYVNDVSIPIIDIDAVARSSKYGGPKIQTGVNLHAIDLDPRVTAESSDLTLRFVSTSKDRSAHVAFYYLWMGPTVKDDTSGSQAPPPNPGDKKTNFNCSDGQRTTLHFDMGLEMVKGWDRNVTTASPEPTYNDSTELEMTVGADNALNLEACAGQQYRIRVASGNGSCDDSFILLVSGQPVAQFPHDPSAESAVPLVHEVQQPVVPSDQNVLSLTFRNTSSDDCGRAGIWWIDLVPVK